MSVTYKVTARRKRANDTYVLLETGTLFSISEEEARSRAEELRELLGPEWTVVLHEQRGRVLA